MTIGKLKEIFANRRKDGALTAKEITEWVNALETRICREIFLTHDSPPPGVFAFMGMEPPVPGQWPQISHPPGYSAEWATEDVEEIELLTPPPYDEIYICYVQWRSDVEQNDIGNISNSRSAYYAAYNDFAKAWNRDHLPVEKQGKGTRGAVPRGWAATEAVHRPPFVPPCVPPPPMPQPQPQPSGALTPLECEASVVSDGGRDVVTLNITAGELYGGLEQGRVLKVTVTGDGWTSEELVTAWASRTVSNGAARYQFWGAAHGKTVYESEEIGAAEPVTVREEE